MTSSIDSSYRAAAMPSLVLHHAPRSRAFTALWLLEELGVPYTLESFSLDSGRNKQPDYLALNPMGKVPLLVHDGVPVAEMGAIAIYAADRFAGHPGAATLAPAIDDPRRAAYLRWILFAAGVIEPGMAQFFFKWEVPARSVAWGSYELMRDALGAGVSEGEWLLGDMFSAADVVVGSVARFGVLFGAFDKTGPIADYVARVSAREAFARASAIEQREGERFPMPTP
jgi:glutathione S-transferase